MAFFTSQGGAVDTLSDLAAVLADPKKLAQNLDEIKQQTKIQEEKLLEVAQAREVLDAERTAFDYAKKVLVEKQDVLDKQTSQFSVLQQKLVDDQKAFQLVKSDFEALKTQTMNEFKVAKDEAVAANKTLAENKNSFDAQTIALKKISLALDEREKALLGREAKAQETIETYENKLAQLKSLL